MLRRLPLSTQIMALVTIATLTASAAMIAITLLGPPPREAPVSAQAISEMLAGSRPAERGMQRVTADAAPSLDGLKRDVRLERELSRELDSTFRAILAGNERGLSRDDNVFGRFVAAQQRSDGAWVIVSSGVDAATRRWIWITLATVLAVLSFILAVAGWFTRRLVGPIHEVSLAAERSEAGQPLILPAIDGPPELGRVVTSLQGLHARTVDHAAQRATMLAAISHDIGTPLARLAFRTETMPEADRAAAIADIETIRLLLANSMVLAQDNGPKTAVSLHDICAMVVEREAELGHRVKLAQTSDAWVAGSSLGLQRVVQNLVDNGLRYANSVELYLGIDGPKVRLEMVDDGPGFPDQPERLLQPFVRGEPSRSVASGGSGLGLTIVAQIVAELGGTLELSNREAGGARVIVTLPGRVQQ